VLFFGVSIGFSMLGQGGGVLYTPIQVFAGIDFHVAATTSLFLIMATSLSSTLVFRRAGRVDWPLAFVLESVTMLGAVGGGLVSGRFAGPTLSLLFAVVVAVAAFFMIRRVVGEPGGRAGGGPFTWRRSVGEHVYCVNMPLALSISFVAGAVSGLVGVGGGILKVPMMVLLFGVPMEIAIGSSALMIGLTAFGGFAGHVASGHWDWMTSLLLAVAVFVGGRIGARRSVTLDRRKVKTAFGWFLLAVAVLMGGKALL
jgi:hypothetical protein